MFVRFVPLVLIFLICGNFPVFAQDRFTFKKDLVSHPLSFDLDAAREFLSKRDFISTSPYFNNPQGHPIGIGHTTAGIVWGHFVVSFSSDSALELVNIKSDHTRKAGDTFINVLGLDFDEEKGKYVGVGTYFGRGPLHCPLVAHTADIEVEVCRTHAFQGAWCSLTVSYTSNKTSAKDCHVGRTEPAKAVASRTFTRVELIQAAEQASKVWREIEPDLRAWVSDRIAELREKISKNELDKNLPLDVGLKLMQLNHRKYLEKIKSAEEFLESFRRLSAITRDLEFLLKFGGRFEHPQSGEFIRYEPGDPLGPVDALKTYVDWAMNEVVGYQRQWLEIESKSKK